MGRTKIRQRIGFDHLITYQSFMYGEKKRKKKKKKEIKIAKWNEEGIKIYKEVWGSNKSKKLERKK